ncbi:gephyrin-like molybdotransferase Glp [Microvirga sp. GCM10011540]|uniref:molybdopterin molybdotransferase MoeA n=1 Tax=Microvirga sp. GCM10011540 TaxID=3317338 RepID=UPI00361FA017
MTAHVPAADVCSEGQGLVNIDTACTRAATYAEAIADTETIAVHRAGGRTLAVNVSAGLAMPAFDQSAMDGYAIALGGAMLPAGTRLPVAGRVAAGDATVALPAGHAVRVFTGAPLPSGADAVLMQEHGWRDGDELILNRMVRTGDNIRRRGEDIEPGESLLSQGLHLDARHVALLSAQGLPDVAVRRRPCVGVISTGNELAQPGSPLASAMIYDSNRPMVMALAAQAGLDVLDGGWVRDDPNALAAVLREVSGRCDLVVTTGGASVGEEDHSASAVARAGGTCETLKIALKPGKPAVIGKIGSAAYLGLPGNPVAALVSWLILGGAVVAALEGRMVRRRQGCLMPAASRFGRRPGRTEFAPGRVVERDGVPAVEILGRGGSARLRPLAEADGLVEIHPLHAPVDAGEMILFHPFRDGFAV